MVTILIVDDQPDNLYVLERLLKRQGYAVVQAKNGPQAIEAAASARPDLILLDVMMPEMDGFEVVRRLRTDGGTDAIPVILLTANAPDERLKIQGLNLGADEYLTQPINNNELLARIRALLRTKQAKDEVLAANSQLRALLAVIQAGGSTLDLEEVGRRLVESIVRAARVEAGGIWLLEDGKLTRVAEAGYPAAREDERGEIGVAPGSMLAHVIADLQPRWESSATIYGPSSLYGEAIQAAIVVPLVHNGKAIGLLQLGSTTAREATPDDVTFIGALANAAATSIQNARLFQETDRQRQRLEALDSEKDEFISIISHELKNPLASIKGYAGLLMRRSRKDANLAVATKGLDVIEQQVNRMTHLLDQLRDVSHIGINRFAIEPHEVDLASLAEHVATGARSTTSDHRIQVDIRDRPLMAHADEFRIEQVLSNLVGNAVKYSPDGGNIEVAVGRRANVSLSNAAPNLPSNWAVMTVKDSGIGIPDAELRRLFERFFRAANAKGRVSGMGLGLFISREIVQRHGGRMWVESQEGQGSLFGVALPPAEN